MSPADLQKFAQENAERFWQDAGNHWLNHRFALRATDHVIEIGGYLGNWTNDISNRYECLIDVYEPIHEYAEHMRKRFSHIPKIKVCEMGVASFTGEAHIAVMDEGSSMFQGGFEKGPLVKVVDIAEIIEKPQGVDLLAINAEGAEYEILQRLIESGKISYVYELLVQFHTFYPDAEYLRDQLRERLAHTHSVGIYYPFLWESWMKR